MPATGDVLPHVKLIRGSTRVTVAPVRSRLSKYVAVNPWAAGTADVGVGVGVGAGAEVGGAEGAAGGTGAVVVTGGTGGGTGVVASPSTSVVTDRAGRVSP